METLAELKIDLNNAVTKVEDEFKKMELPAFSAKAMWVTLAGVALLAALAVFWPAKKTPAPAFQAPAAEEITLPAVIAPAKPSVWRRQPAKSAVSPVFTPSPIETPVPMVPEPPAPVLAPVPEPAPEAKPAPLILSPRQRAFEERIRSKGIS